MSTHILSWLAEIFQKEIFIYTIVSCKAIVQTVSTYTGHLTIAISLLMGGLAE